MNTKTAPSTILWDYYSVVESANPNPKTLMTYLTLQFI